MMKKFNFISGLPRSGSTLLANILLQNPRFHATATSGIVEILFGVRNMWDSLIEFKAHPNDDGKLRVLKGILENFYEDIEVPVIFDKSRGWLSLIEMIEFVLDQKVKILVPVRDIRDILASFEKLWRNTSKLSQVPMERERYFKSQTIQGRCQILMEDNQVVGLSYNRLVDAISRGFRDRMYFVKFEELTSNPEKVMKEIYEFLEEDLFEHNFSNVRQVTWEHDDVHGFKGLHDIRTKIEPIPPQWPTILGNFAEPYKKMNEIWSISFNSQLSK